MGYFESHTILENEFFNHFYAIFEINGPWTFLHCDMKCKATAGWFSEKYKIWKKKLSPHSIIEFNAIL